MEQFKVIGINIVKFLNENMFYRMVLKTSLIFLLGTWMTKEF